MKSDSITTKRANDAQLTPFASDILFNVKLRLRSDPTSFYLILKLA